MAKKNIRKTATWKNINAINRYIKNVAEIFGTESEQYDIATNQLNLFDFTYNKNGIKQIRNTAENRKKHQTVRRIKNQRKNITKEKAKIQAKIDKRNKRVRNEANRIESIKQFNKLQRDTEDKYDAIYNHMIPILMEYAENHPELDISKDQDALAHRLFSDINYYDEMKLMVEEIGRSQEDTDIKNTTLGWKNTVTEVKDGTAYVIDEKTGELIDAFDEFFI